MRFKSPAQRRAVMARLRGGHNPHIPTKRMQMPEGLERLAQENNYKFSFLRNTEKSPYLGSRFGQDIEPKGTYMIIGNAKQQSEQIEYFTKMGVKGWERGTVEFKNPLIINWENWKANLSEKYNGLTGNDLSKAIIKDGYDGIITMDKGNPSEVVSLTDFYNQTGKGTP